MAYTFTGAIAWDVIGASVQVAANTRSISITDPATRTPPTGLQQSGRSVSWVTTDSQGGYAFTCDAPSVIIDFGGGTFSLYSTEVQVTAINATATDYINPDQSARAPGAAVTLAGLTRPGWYYLSAAQSAVMTDLPADAGTATANFLEVSGLSSAGTGMCTQRLSRATVSTTYKSWWRTVDITAGQVGPWISPDSIIDLPVAGLITWADANWVEGNPGTGADSILYSRVGRTHQLTGIVKTLIARTVTSTSSTPVATLANALFLPPRRNINDYPSVVNSATDLRVILTSGGSLIIQQGAGTSGALVANDTFGFALTWLA